MTPRNIDDAIKRRLRVRAAVNGRLMEDEPRDILRSALSTNDPHCRNLAQATHERFSGIDLTVVPREASRTSVDFGE